MDSAPFNILLRSPLRVNQRGMVQRNEEKKKPVQAASLGTFARLFSGVQTWETNYFPNSAAGNTAPIKQFLGFHLAVGGYKLLLRSQMALAEFWCLW